MYQPNKQLREILVACVKPKYLQSVTERAIEIILVYDGNKLIIQPHESVTKNSIELELNVTNFDEVLECGKWYDREKFDGNPCDYIVVEQCGDEGVNYDANVAHALWNSTTHFMYIKKP